MNAAFAQPFYVLGGYPRKGVRDFVFLCKGDDFGVKLGYIVGFTGENLRNLRPRVLQPQRRGIKQINSDVCNFQWLFPPLTQK